MDRAAGASQPDRLSRLTVELARDPRAIGRIRLPDRPGVTSTWPEWLDPQVRTAYADRGIEAPWRHQVRAAELAWAGRHVVIATGTASGKTAAFGMPGLTAALTAPGMGSARGQSVLYLAPTKALAHDQLAGLTALGLADLRAAAVDGDTDDEDRAWARAHARWLLTNPDMLHRSILPGHERWRGLLRALRFVVVDEAHVYRGVFGAHVGLVLRRLRRVARRYGADPTFVLASATVADPGTVGARLLGVPVEVVDSDDSAHGPVELLLWDPLASRRPDAELVVEDRGDIVEAPTPPAGSATLPASAELMTRLVDHDLTTLAFARSRRAVEVLSARVRDQARHGDRVRAYRGGYLPEERRQLETELRAGRLLGLAATNALELGIDVSGVTAVVLAGWPGTRSSFWQQVGRAGRRGSAALAVLVPREDPLDRFVVTHPETLTGRPVEATVLDPDNPYVLAGHLCAASAEVPLRDDDLVDWFGPTAPQLCAVLADQGLLRRRRDGWYWTDPSRPADLVDLRGASGGPVRVVESSTGRLLGTVDPTSAPAAVHPGAVYVHQGAAYEVTELDLAARVAVAAATVTDLSTHARSTVDVRLEGVRMSTCWGPVTVSFGDVAVTSQVTSYLVRRWPSGQVLAEHPLDLPAVTLETAGMWWTIPDEVLAEAGVSPDSAPGALHALEHAAIGMLPLMASCDRWDIGGVSTMCHPQSGQATIVVHDGHPGGAGFAERGYECAETWLRATSEAIGNCACATGCPSCVQSPKCGNGNEPLDKDAALRLTRRLLAHATAPQAAAPDGASPHAAAPHAAPEPLIVP